MRLLKLLQPPTLGLMNGDVGLTVLDATTMGEDEAKLLLAELQNNGLATLITNAQTAMPEQVALLLTLLNIAQE